MNDDPLTFPPSEEELNGLTAKYYIEMLDRFAIAALPALITTSEMDSTDSLAEVAYDIAQAMMSKHIQTLHILREK